MVAIAPEVVLALRVQVSFLLDALISVAIHAAIPSRVVIVPLRLFCLLMLVGELPVIESNGKSSSEPWCERDKVLHQQF